jgi:hypothetical protein
VASGPLSGRRAVGGWRRGHCQDDGRRRQATGRQHRAAVSGGQVTLRHRATGGRGRGRWQCIETVELRRRVVVGGGVRSREIIIKCEKFRVGQKRRYRRRKGNDWFAIPKIHQCQAPTDEIMPFVPHLPWPRKFISPGPHQRIYAV